jgi:hypothetical protein
MVFLRISLWSIPLIACPIQISQLFILNKIGWVFNNLANEILLKYLQKIIFWYFILEYFLHFLHSFKSAAEMAFNLSSLMRSSARHKLIGVIGRKD